MRINSWGCISGCFLYSRTQCAGCSNRRGKDCLFGLFCCILKNSRKFKIGDGYEAVCRGLLRQNQLCNHGWGPQLSNEQNAAIYTTKPIEIYACAEDVPQTVWVKNYGNLNPLTVKWQLKINGKLYKASYTFQDSTIALENLKSKCGRYLKLLQKQYHLQDLSLDTYESYYYSIFKFRSTASYDSSVKDAETELTDEENLTEAALSWGVGMYTNQKIVLSWVEQQNKLLKAGKEKKIDLEPVMHILSDMSDPAFQAVSRAQH